MHRREIEAVADALRTANRRFTGGNRAVSVVVSELVANAVATTNPSFDRAKFLKAAGVDAQTKI